MGVYGSIQRHTDANPGTFTVLMNRDYWGLNAEVGLRVGDGAWQTIAMQYAGNTDGNSRWQYTPAEPFPAGSTVTYYFHGFDGAGGDIWDSDYSRNFRFYHVNRGVISGQTTSWSGWTMGDVAKATSLAGNSTTLVAAGRDPDNATSILVFTSPADGVTFSDARRIDLGSLKPLSVAVSAGPGSEFLIAFANEKASNGQVFAEAIWTIRSSDNGATWAAPVLAYQADPSRSNVIWQNTLEAGYNPAGYFVGFKVLQSSAAHNVYYVARSADGILWTTSLLTGGKYFGGGKLLVTSSGAFVTANDGSSNTTSFWAWNGAGWETRLSFNPASAGSLASDGRGNVFLVIQEGRSNTVRILSTANAGGSFASLGTATSPATGGAPATAQAISGNGRFHLRWTEGGWRDCAWQTGVLTTPAQALGSVTTYQYPAEGSLSVDDDLWINVESGPRGAGVSSSVVYTVDGAHWQSAPLALTGTNGDRDW